MDIRKSGFYPYISSLADEIKRSLIADFGHETNMSPICKMAPIGTAPSSRVQDDFLFNGHDAEDFRNNGRDLEDFADAVSTQFRPDSAFPLGPRVLYGGSSGSLGIYGGDRMTNGVMICSAPAATRPFPRYVNHPGVQTTQDIIRRAIIGGAGSGQQVASGNGGRPGNVSSRRSECVFCRNNGEERRLYQSHVLKDKAGKVTCPVLRVYVCPVCDASGDMAHTLRYCPLNKSRLAGPDLSSAIRSTRTSTSRRGGQRQLSG